MYIHVYTCSCSSTVQIVHVKLDGENHRIPPSVASHCRAAPSSWHRSRHHSLWLPAHCCETPCNLPANLLRKLYRFTTRKISAPSDVNSVGNKNQNLAVTMAAARAVTADTVPEKPNVAKGRVNTCHQQKNELDLNWKQFLTFGRLRQIVVKHVGILLRKLLLCSSCIVWILCCKSSSAKRPEEHDKFAIRDNHQV